MVDCPRVTASHSRTPPPQLGAVEGRSLTKVLPAVRFRLTTKAPCEERVGGRRGVCWTAPESPSLSPTLALHSVGRGGVEAAWPLLGKGLSAVRFRRHTDEPFDPTAVPSRGRSRTTSSTPPTSSCTKDPEKSCCGKSRLPGTSAGEPFPVRVPAKEAEKSGSCKAIPTGTSAGDPVLVRDHAAAKTSLRSASSPSTSTFETRPGKQLSRIAVNTG